MADDRVRVALIGPLPPPAGGMANQTLQLARLLREAGLAVEIVQVNAPYRPAWIGSLRGVRAIVRLVPYIAALRRAVRAADLVHVMANSGWAFHLFAAPAILAARSQGVPCVVNYRGGEARPFLERQAAWVRRVLQRAGALIVPSAFLMRVFREFDIEAEIVPNIVDLERFSPAPAPPRSPVLLVARNLEPLYDIGTALRALAIVRGTRRDAHLVVAGSGPDRAALETLAAQLGVADGVEFTGRLDPESVAHRYRAATVAVNPSLADNMPNSLLEAMACGVPIVSTDVGGVPDLVAHEKTAILVPPGDASAMAQAILRVLDDAVLAQRLRGAGIAAAHAYTWDAVRPRLFAVYARLLQRAVADVGVVP